MEKYGFKILVASAVLFTLMITGCSFFTKTPTQNDVMLSQIAVTDAASIEAIQDPNLIQPMITVSTMVINDVNSGKVVTLADIQAEINAEATALHLSPKTVALADLFLQNMILIIQQKGQVSLTVPAQVCMVAQWTNNAVGGNAVCTQQLSPITVVK